ncbi:hypothetical protein [Polymorphospora rubra]|uniref:Uncharacterized protein n=1 Tax=Polymorphospora rubra TaxID=338584 RepID=A0A810MVA8_9ACTN|nr:hypothetical protein [Polymorphospora rubra]BCJ65107.1 hypothetical protein Prubr_21280 [Polymorphospora rubra]
MTEPVQPVRKLSISVPADVAARLDKEPNASAFLARAARTQMRADAFAATLAGRGLPITPEGRRRAAERLDAIERAYPPSWYDEQRARHQAAAEAEFGGPRHSQAPAA